MKYIALEELQKHIIHDGCDEGCGYIDERDLATIPTVNLDKIRAEIDQYLFQNEFGSAYRKEVSQIIDKYKAERPLPKGHGRLIDADKLEPRDISPEAWYSPMWGFELVDIEDAPTIIEADGGDAE